jgi:hypothetical protein
MLYVWESKAASHVATMLWTTKAAPEATSKFTLPAGYVMATVPPVEEKPVDVSVPPELSMKSLEPSVNVERSPPVPVMTGLFAASPVMVALAKVTDEVVAISYMCVT